MKYLKPYFIFCARVTTLAWRASPLKNLSVLAAVIISALALIACPILLGYGVQRTLENPEVWRQNFAVLVILYSILWLIGQSFRYLFYPAYGFIEQKMQSRHMADALVTSIGADPGARATLGASEIASMRRPHPFAKPSPPCTSQFCPPGLVVSPVLSQFW